MTKMKMMILLVLYWWKKWEGQQHYHHHYDHQLAILRVAPVATAAAVASTRNSWQPSCQIHKVAWSKMQKKRKKMKKGASTGSRKNRATAEKNRFQSKQWTRNERIVVNVSCHFPSIVCVVSSLARLRFCVAAAESTRKRVFLCRSRFGSVFVKFSDSDY